MTIVISSLSLRPCVLTLLVELYICCSYITLLQHLRVRLLSGQPKERFIFSPK